MQRKHLMGLSVAALMACMANQAYADNIAITTTSDDTTTGSTTCSLRQAVELINSGELNYIDSKRTVLNGCARRANDAVTTTYTAVIELQPNKTYTLTQGPLLIKNSMSIQSANLNDVNDPAGVHNPIITTTLPVRLMEVNDGKSAATSVSNVTLSQIDLQGCATTTAQQCATNGGLISNLENLTISRVHLSGGQADLGGAVYMSSPIDGSLTLDQVIAKNNTATQGSVIWVAGSKFQVTRSLLRDNVATGSNGSAIYSDQDLTVDSTARTGQISSSTLYHNTGYAVTLRSGMSVQSDTIIGNTLGGVYLNAQLKTGSNLSNSIIAGNGTSSAPTDCVFARGDQSYLNNLVYTGGCGGTIDAAHQMNLQQISNTGNQTLIANANNDGQCDKPPAVGMLCPIGKNSPDDFSEYFKPRLLASYQKLTDSPIVDKGVLTLTNNQNTGFMGCQYTDQRGKARTNCDIGAIELVISGSSQTNGKDILYGETATFDLKDVLGDGELMPASSCAQVYPNISAPTGGWKTGCLNYTVAPTKGTLTINADNTVTYTPGSNYHGADIFTYQLTSTTSRFSDGINDRSLNVTTTIVQAPPNTFVSKTAKLGVGATGLLSLLGLATAALIRRRTTGV